MNPINQPAMQLTAEQLRLAQHFATMDATRQHHLITIAAALAKEYPGRAKPTLRIVKGGAA